MKGRLNKNGCHRACQSDDLLLNHVEWTGAMRLQFIRGDLGTRYSILASPHKVTIWRLPRKRATVTGEGNSRIEVLYVQRYNGRCTTISLISTDVSTASKLQTFIKFRIRDATVQ